MTPHSFVRCKPLNVLLCFASCISCALCFEPGTRKGVPLEVSSRVLPSDLKECNFPIWKSHRDTWIAFYTCSTESEDISILVRAGSSIVPELLRAVADKRLYKRRYAIGALGYLKNKSAIAILRTILNDSAEKEYFRGDALRAKYIIDQALGRSEAHRLMEHPEVTGRDPYFFSVVKAIINSPETIELKWKENYDP